MKCASFFAGVGGIDLGFEMAGFETTYANEIDKNATKTYENNFNIKVDNRDIKEVVNDLVHGKDVIGNIDILLAGFPCQAFSIAGYRQGFLDDKGRGNLFFDVMEIVNIKKPKIIFLENVKNLVSHDKGNTFKVITESLENCGYHIRHKVLNSMEYGNVPQNRERIYIIAFLDKKMADNFSWPDKIELTNSLDKVIDYHKQDDKFYYTADNFSKYNEVKDVINKKNTVYQWRRVYVRENKNNVCPTLTANMGTGGHNVPLIYTDEGIRKLTPRECFSLQGFPQDYKLPIMANSHLYKQAGNSVSVTVIYRIAKQISYLLEKE